MALAIGRPRPAWPLALGLPSTPPARWPAVGVAGHPVAFLGAAQFGRGTFTYIGSPLEVTARMDELFRKLERPTLADVAVEWGHADDETWPNRVPDLYAGEPLVLAVRLHDLPETVAVSGSIGAAPWRVVIHRPPLDETGGGISQLWARRKIDALMDGRVYGAERDEMRDAVVEVALEHHLVSAYTSLVAVDVTPTAPTGAHLLTREIPVNAPHGSLMLASTATPAPLYAVIAAAFLLLALLPHTPCFDWQASRPGRRPVEGAAPWAPARGGRRSVGAGAGEVGEIGVVWTDG
jgi:Ca-activated chloride channel family protein